MELKIKQPKLERDIPTVSKPKRNLDNSELIKFFGKGKLNIWKKDIETGNSSF